MPHRATTGPLEPAPAPQVGGSSDAAVASLPAPRKHPFLEAAHHPFIAGISHICSPLSAFLFVFAVHKSWQRRAAGAWWEAQRAVRIRNDGPSSSSSSTTAAKRATKASTSASTANMTGGVGAGKLSVGARHFCTYRHSSAFRPCAFAPLSATAAAAMHAPRRFVSRSSSSNAGSLAPLFQYRTTPQASVAAVATVPQHQRPSAFAMQEQETQQQAPANPSISERFAAPLNAARSSLAAAMLLVSSAPLSASTAAATVVPHAPSLADLYGAEDVPFVLEHLSHVWSVVQMQDLITWVHATSGLPWWGSIAAATLLLRTLAVPFEVAMMRNSLRLKQILPQVDRLRARMNNTSDVDMKQKHARALLQLFKDHRSVFASREEEEAHLSGSNLTLTLRFAVCCA